MRTIAPVMLGLALLAGEASAQKSDAGQADAITLDIMLARDETRLSLKLGPQLVEAQGSDDVDALNAQIERLVNEQKYAEI